MRYPTYIRIPKQELEPLPARFKSVDVRYSPALVEYFLSKFTKEGDMVFDPFVGFGTTLAVAKKMKRQVFGTEIHQDRVNYLHDQLGLVEVKQADITKFSVSELPDINFLMTSPPFMGEGEHADALTGYRYAGSYEEYLERLQQVFVKLKPKFCSNATVILEVSNLKDEHHLTTLAWDVGKMIAEVLPFEGEVIVIWEGKRSRTGIYGYGYDHSYCLVYRLL